MFEVTEKASEMIKEALKNQEKASSIRIVLNEGGCCGPSLGIALDEPNGDDKVFTKFDVTYIINKDLLEKAKPIKVDFITTPRGSGFSISSSLQSSCGSCSC